MGAPDFASVSSRPMAVERRRTADLVDEIVMLAVDAVGTQGSFTVVLAGGRTPHPVYRELEACGTQAGVEWDRWTVLLSDERCLPPSHAGRNDAGVAESLPSLATAGRIRAIPVELGAERAASAYACIVADADPVDLALLGLGADGHTAGIFPSAETPHAGPDDAAPRLCRAVDGAPEPFPDRVTLTELALSSARRAWFLVDADDRSKDAAVASLVGGEGVAARITAPARRIVLLAVEPQGESSG